MSIAEQLNDFFYRSGQKVFIEVEGKPQAIDSFIRKYNSNYAQNISKSDDGIIVLKEDANKWGIELRMYFNDKSGVPNEIHVTKTNGYRDNYYFRINDTGLIYGLFDLGYRIGENYTI